MKYYDELLPMFVGNDDLRPALMQANTIGDFTYATDAYALLIVPTRLLLKEYPAHKKVPDIKAILPDSFYYKPKLIKKDCVDAILSKIKKITDTTNCPTCDGDGYLMCDLDHRHDCDECNGDGLVGDPTKPKVFPYDKYVTINSIAMSAHQIGRLQHTFEYTEQSECKLVCGSADKAHLFEFGEIKLLIMPISSNRNIVHDPELAIPCQPS